MRIFLIFLLLAGCSTTQLASKEPVATYRSTKARGEVTDCLLNRLAGSMSRVKAERGATANRVIVLAPLGNPALVFDITDDGSGSAIAFHRLSAITSGRTNAESCFDT